MKNSWLKDHITSLIAILTVIACTTIQLIILLKETKSDPQTTGTVLQGTLGIEMLVLSYYFGASKIKPEPPKEDNSVQINSNNQKTDTQ
jgi:hypothetical protein